MMDELLEQPDGTVRGGDRLSDLEDWNSLAVIGFMAKVNTDYGLILSPQQIAQCTTVNELEALTEASATK